MFWGIMYKRKMETCHEDSCHLVKALLFRLPVESVTMGGSKKIFILMYVLAALIELGFGNQYICRNPQYYKDKNVTDPGGNFVGECVSFYKVTILSIDGFVGRLFETLMILKIDMFERPSINHGMEEGT
jgi:hypothetical protein